MSEANEGALEPDVAARFEAVADALDVLIRFHDREPDRDFLRGLRDAGVTDWLADAVLSDDGQAAVADLGTALAELPDPVTDEAMDQLAAEYADIYLTHSYRISPSGSVWLTEDQLERQMPMFDVRDWYAHYDVTVPDWRLRADDHLVHELQFLSFLLRRRSLVAASDAARFMDLHVLSWIPDFCVKGRPMLRQKLFRAVFDLTVALLDEMRDLLEEHTQIARQVVQREPAPANPMQDGETAFVPGAAESW